MILTSKITISTRIVSYPSPGLYLVEDSNLVLTAGEAILDASYEIVYPEVSEEHDSCKPLSQDLKDKINAATTLYKNNIREYIQLGESPSSNGNTTEPSNEDPFEACVEDESCIIAPLLTEALVGQELWPIPCRSKNIGNIASCNDHKTNASYTACCDIKGGENNKYCPTGRMVKARSIVRKWKNLHGRHKFSIGGALQSVKKQDLFCFAITHMEKDGRLEKLTDQKIDVAASNANWYVKTHKRKRRSTTEPKRVRRSWSNILHYYMAGGPLTPKYTLTQIKKFKREEEVKITDLKTALATDEAAIVRLQREDSKAGLSKKICDLGTKLTESLIVENLKAQQDAEFGKVQALVGTCEEGIVPNEVSTTLLEQICKASSESPTCWSLKTRSLTSCEVRFVQMVEDRVIVVLRLRQRTPVSEAISLFSVVTTPVYTDRFMVGEKPKTTTIEPTTLDQKRIMAEKLAKLLAKRRKRATVMNHFVTRELRLPPFLVISGDSASVDAKTKILTFDKVHKQGRLKLLFAEERLPQNGCLEALVKTTELNPKEKFPAEKCLVKEERTTAACTVRSLPSAGYIVSTPNNQGVDIISTATKQAKSVFGNGQSDSMSCSQCIVKPNEGTRQTFRCETTDYVVQESQTSIVDHISKNVNVDLREFKQKDNVLPEVFGVQKLDALEQNKNYQKAFRICMIVTIIGLYASIIGICVCKFGRRCSRKCTLPRCWKGNTFREGFKKA